MSDVLPPLPQDPLPGRYRHYKGNEYIVEGLARHSETLEVLVVYRACYGDTTARWVRPRDMFQEELEINGIRRPRFERLPDEARA